MRTATKTIKGIAIIIAIVLIVVIAYLFIQAILFFGDTNKNKTINNKDINKNITDIVIDLKFASLTVDTCSKYRVDTDNEFVKVEVVDKKLRIKEKKHNPITRKDTDSINLCLKDDAELNSIYLDMGAGKLKIDELNTKSAGFDLGAGSIELNKLNITDQFKLDGGAGSINIDNSVLNNSEIDLGVGVLNFTGRLLGETKVEGGIGSINMTIIDNKDNYKFVVDKGIGRVTIDGTNYSNTTFGEGANLIKLETGIGSATIIFKNNEL